MFWVNMVIQNQMANFLCQFQNDITTDVVGKNSIQKQFLC